MITDMVKDVELPEHDLNITAQDRCDNCNSAQALVRVGRIVLDKNSEPILQELQFCGHHFTNHEKKLLKHTWEITVDKRDEIS